MRRNNKLDMTVTEQIQAIKEDMCNKNCKYHGKKTEEAKEKCQECPLKKL